MTSPLPTRAAPAPSPSCASSGVPGATGRTSPAATKAWAAEPAFTVSSASRSAVVPHRSEPPRSAGNTAGDRSATVARMAALHLFAQGALRVAKKIPARVEEANQRQPVRGGRLEASGVGSHREIPAAGRTRRLDRLRLGPVAEDARESQRAVLVLLFVDAEIRDHRAHGAAGRRDVRHLVHEAGW